MSALAGDALTGSSVTAARCAGGGHNGCILHWRTFVTHGASLLAVLTLAAAASGHVPPVAGRLVDCIQRSDIVVVAVIEQTADIDTRTLDTTARIERSILGAPGEPTIVFRGNARFVPRQRYVIFLHREGGALVGVQPAGVSFPSAPGDDALYHQVVTAARAALVEQDDRRVDQLRSALIPALQAAPRELRYNAALELGALAHHGVKSAEHRRQLESIAADPRTDPTLRKMIEVINGSSKP